MGDCTFAWVFREALRSGRYVRLTYNAPKRGGITTRTIVVRKLEGDYIHALHDRHHRMFRLDRVKEAQLL